MVSKWVVLAVILAVLAAMLVQGCSRVRSLAPASTAEPAAAPIESSSSPERAVLPQWAGKVAPDFALELFDGRSFRLSELRGKPVVLNFWASWCPPCRDEMPALERAWQKYQGQVAFLGVAVSDTEEKALATARRYGVTYDLGLDRTNTIAIDYRVIAMPSTYFIDGNGVVTKHVAGQVTEGAMGFFIDLLLRQ